MARRRWAKIVQILHKKKTQTQTKVLSCCFSSSFAPSPSSCLFDVCDVAKFTFLSDKTPTNEKFLFDFIGCTHRIGFASTDTAATVTMLVYFGCLAAPAVASVPIADASFLVDLPLVAHCLFAYTFPCVALSDAPGNSSQSSEQSSVTQFCPSPIFPKVSFCLLFHGLR